MPSAKEKLLQPPSPSEVIRTKRKGIRIPQINEMAVPLGAPMPQSKEIADADEATERAKKMMDLANRENQDTSIVPKNPTETINEARSIAQINNDNETVDNVVKKLIERTLDFQPEDSKVKPNEYWNQNAQNENSKQLVVYIAAAVNSDDECAQKIATFSEKSQRLFVYYASIKLSSTVITDYNINESRIKNFFTPFAKHYFYTPLLRDEIRKKAEADAEKEIKINQEIDKKSDAYKNAVERNIHKQLVKNALKPAIKTTDRKLNIT